MCGGSIVTVPVFCQELLAQVGGDVTQRVLEEKLFEHIENASFDVGAQGGVGGDQDEQERENFYLVPLPKQKSFKHLVETPLGKFAVNVQDP